MGAADADPLTLDYGQKNTITPPNGVATVNILDRALLAADRYRKRQPMIEPVLGQAKFNHCIDRFQRTRHTPPAPNGGSSPPPTTSSSATATASTRPQSRL